MMNGASVVERLRAPRTEPSLILLAADGSEQTYYHDELLRRGEAWRSAMTQAGAEAGDAVVIILEHGVDLYGAFVGAILGGMIPSIFAHPSEKYAHDHYFNNVGCWMDSARANVLITYPTLANRLAEVGVLRRCSIVTAPAKTIVVAETGVTPETTASSIVFQQFTSGTTGLKKGVQISEAQLLWQVDHYGSAISLQANDRVASWLPLYHDMGLITCCLMPLLTGVPVVAMSPFDWVARPEMLLLAVHRHRCTLSWMPNFAFSLMAERIDRQAIRSVNLSSWRGIVNCAEPLNMKSVLAFKNRFVHYGLAPNALATSYAMAEATFAVTSGGFGVPAMVDEVDPRALESQQQAVVSSGGRLMLSSGQVLPGATVEIRDKQGGGLADRQVGEIFIRCPCLVGGYADGGDESFVQGGFYTGDTGYLVGEQLFVIGRIKDTLIIAGRNLYPQDVESVVETVDGIVAGRSVAFGIDDLVLGTQKLVVLAESKATEDKQRKLIIAQIRQLIVSELDVVPFDVRVLNPMTLIKSTSGKISRVENRALYLRNLSAGTGAKAEKGCEAVGEIGVKTEGRLEQASEMPVDKLRLLLRGCVSKVIQEIRGGTSIGFDHDHDHGDGDGYDDDTALVAEGVLDSFAFVSLVAAIEKALNCPLPQDIKQNALRYDSINSFANALVAVQVLGDMSLGQLKSSETTRNEANFHDAPRANSIHVESTMDPKTLAPQMSDVARQGYEWVPYLMRRGKGGFRSATLNSDEHGFRRAVDCQGELAYERWLTGNWQHGVILGNSVAYGVGTCGDENILGNRLNRRDSNAERRWYTLALRASNLTQERLALEMFGPLNKQWVVWVSGINELVALIVGEGEPGRLPPFVGERAWRQAIGASSGAIDRQDSLSQRYHSVLNAIERDLCLVSQQCLGVGAEFLFILQPALSWIEKKLTVEEAVLVEVFDSAASPLQRAHSKEQLGAYQVRYRHDIAAICKRNGIEFIDANASPRFLMPDWLFIDRTHLTDLGHQQLEGLVTEWLGTVQVRHSQPI